MAKEQPPSLDCAPIPSVSNIEEVRTGDIRTLSQDGSVTSAIFKKPRIGSVKLSDLGLAGDQQQSLAHGEIHKALHQYNASHYASWQSEPVANREMFKPGAFGENLVTYGLSEENVCIGDQFRIGNEAIVEISEPRVPCHKLNHRFQWSQATKRAQRSGRIGWYLRVLKTGWIQAGDSMQLLTRPYPRWSILNAHKVLHSRPFDRAMLLELRDVVPLGPGAKALADRRLADIPDWKIYRLRATENITKRVRQFTFFLNDTLDVETGVELPDCSYVNVEFGPVDHRFRRSYSVVSGDRNEFVLGVALDDNSRGGSRFLHKELKAGDDVKVLLEPDNTEAAIKEKHKFQQIDRHIFVIGGIGVTAFLNKIQTLKDKHVSVEVHYACRSLSEAAYSDKLPIQSTTFYPKSEQKRLNVDHCIPDADECRRSKCMIYCCGPSGLMHAVEARTRELQYPEDQLHFESFGSDAGEILGDPFEVEVCDIEKERRTTLQVPANQTLLKTLNDAGFTVESHCQAGKCGICAVSLCSGEVEHKGTALTQAGKLSTMLTCISRGKGKIEIEIE